MRFHVCVLCGRVPTLAALLVISSAGNVVPFCSRLRVTVDQTVKKNNLEKKIKKIKVKNEKCGLNRRVDLGVLGC